MMHGQFAACQKQDSLIGYLPNQPPAGKLEYYLTLHKQSEEHVMPMGEKVIIRFRGDVPAGIIIPHASLCSYPCYSPT
jgi:hypothetical protein